MDRRDKEERRQKTDETNSALVMLRTDDWRWGRSVYAVTRANRRGKERTSHCRGEHDLGPTDIEHERVEMK